MTTDNSQPSPTDPEAVAWRDGYEQGTSHGRTLAGRRMHPFLAASFGAIAALLVCGIAAAAVLFSSRDEAPETFAVAGTMTLTESRGWSSSPGGCEGDGGYDDIHEGAQVKVTDEQGRTLGTGQLGVGRTRSSTCYFNFVVVDVPAGSSFYEVEVSRRGGLTYSEEEARAPLAFTLG